jgi:hypothetical protein
VGPLSEHDLRLDTATRRHDVRGNPMDDILLPPLPFQEWVTTKDTAGSSGGRDKVVESFGGSIQPRVLRGWH